MCAVAQLVKRATPDEEAAGLIPTVAAYWLGQCQYNVTG